jgi:AAA domain, putative AbiEii toxin, Type IV TA system
MQTISRLNNLLVRNFRAFRHLSVEGLSDVNLIVGANNLGKSSLLEALHLYFLRGSRTRIPELLLAREEFSFKRMRTRTSFRVQDVALAYESLFFGRPRLETTPSLRIGPLNNDAPNLEITFTWLREITEELEGTVTFRTVKAAPGDDLEVLPGLDISFDDRQILVSLDRLDRDIALRSRLAREPEVNVVYLSSQGLGREEMGRLWDTIALTEDEDTIVSALRSISPSIEKIVLVQTPNARNTRTLMVKLEEFPEPVPFKSLGEGVEHLLSISLALIRARNGIILIDEVENGIHYSVQHSLWDMIFKQAKRWNIQVFATTHSWDCVEGFQIASSTLRGSASLFRLERRDANIGAVRFEPKEIEIARRESIEVR